MLDDIKYFFYLGLTGFGGPLILIKQMRTHFAEKNKKISTEEFDQVFALIKAMPGPVAFQMAVFLGQKFHHFRGAFSAGAALLLPAFIMMILAGYYYDSFSHDPRVMPVLEGLLFAASAVILLSLKNLVIGNRNDLFFWAILAVNLVLSWFHVLPEPVLIVIFGLMAVLKDKFIDKKIGHLSVGFLFVDTELLYKLFKICAYAGAFVFGTGFALIPVLKTNMVDVHQLISIKQFNDGVVFGQMTPGPITITATFLGYQISGLAGAVTATFGIFLFPFIHMATWFPHAIAWMRRQKWISRFVMGATAAVVAGIVTTVVQMNMSFYGLFMFWFIFCGTLVWMYLKSNTPVLLVFFVGGLLNLFSTWL